MLDGSINFDGLGERLGEQWAGPIAQLKDRPAAVLAVSGGPDSMAMLAGLALLQKAGLIQTQLIVASVDHGLRTCAADEVALVTRVADLFDLPCVSIKLSPPKSAGDQQTHQPQSTNIQAWAREKRYAFLADVARDHGAVVLTAHTADDQAETLLMRAARGTGTEGLAGIREQVRLYDCTVMRPFLAWTREALHAVLDDVGIEPAHDPSNHDPAYTRVRFRDWLDIAPDPDGARSLVEGMAQTARLAAQDSDALTQLANQQFAALGGAWRGYVQGVVQLGPLPTALMARLVRQVMHSVCRQSDGEQVFDLARMSELAARLHTKRYGKTVLGSACLEWETGPQGVELLAYAEAGRDGFSTVTIASGEAAAWDNRYWVENPTGRPVHVRGYDKHDSKDVLLGLPGGEKNMPPPRVMATLPVVLDMHGTPLASAVPGFLDLSTADGLHLAHIPRR